MHPAVSMLSILFSVLVPQKMWYANSQPLNFTVQSDQPTMLDMTDFSGAPISASGSSDVDAGQTVNLRKMFPSTGLPGTYLLYARPRGSAPIAGGMPKDFLGTPVVIETIANPRTDIAAPMVIHVVPLQYAVFSTALGKATAVFYYDVAPHTDDVFLELASQGYFNGLMFHRIVPGFVVQGGDPSNTGTGTPGFHIEAEFNDKPHLEGVLSMARMGDPNEDASMGVGPRPEFANSAGSQFFICLDYRRTVKLNHVYTAFGRVVEGMDVIQKIAKSPVLDKEAGTPGLPQMINKVEVFPVSADNNPYAIVPAAAEPTTAPSAGK
jgi:peptidyl-prolyl cis-trans isomerase B (cyclophilin B)